MRAVWGVTISCVACSAANITSMDDASAPLPDAAETDQSTPPADAMSTPDTSSDALADVTSEEAAVTTCSVPPTHSGGLTQYDQTSQNNCGVPWPSDNLYAAISTPDYDSPTPSGACGKCLEVTGPGPSFTKATFLAVDQCPTATNSKCVTGHLDLSHTAFSAVVPSNYVYGGEVPNADPISWKYVACNVTGNIVYHFKDGTSSYWAAVQVRNARYGIAKIRYRNGSTWTDMTDRTDALAYFTTNLSNVTTIDLQAIDENGQVLEDDGISLGANVDRAGKGQFPLCN
jgi:expansin (peptidoglycan-binding protein)